MTPRLLLTSPVRGCGKTTLLRVLERLVARAERCDNTTAAAIYAAIDEDGSTLLLDEADNLNVAAKGALQAVLHAGFQQGGSIARMVRGKRKQYNVFAPIALAAIGTAWSSLPLLSRSIVIRMRRHDGSFKLRRLDPEDTRDLDAASIYLRDWLERVEISRDPPLPEQLGDRSKDLWRPLVALADASGADWGERARAAALALSSDLEQDLGVVLLDHIRVVFDRLAVDRIPTKTLVAELLALDIADGLWQEVVRERGGPRKLTTACWRRCCVRSASKRGRCGHRIVSPAPRGRGDIGARILGRPGRPTSAMVPVTPRRGVRRCGWWSTVMSTECHTATAQ